MALAEFWAEEDAEIQAADEVKAIKLGENDVDMFLDVDDRLNDWAGSHC